jgi:hypothetical protein
VRRTQQEYWRRASALHEAATQVWHERRRRAEAPVWLKQRLHRRHTPCMHE